MPHTILNYYGYVSFYSQRWRIYLPSLTNLLWSLHLVSKYGHSLLSRLRSCISLVSHHLQDETQHLFYNLCCYWWENQIHFPIIFKYHDHVWSTNLILKDLLKLTNLTISHYDNPFPSSTFYKYCLLIARHVSHIRTWIKDKLINDFIWNMTVAQIWKLVKNWLWFAFLFICRGNVIIVFCSGQTYICDTPDS